MRPFFRNILISAVSVAAPFAVLSAQEQTPEERKAEQEFYDSISSQVDRLAEQLDLDDGQIFYVDSILVHDYKAMQAELKALQDKKVSNSSLYYDVQDKWQDRIYYSFQKLFDDEQWAKYQKTGAERAKKSRDKRRAKSQKQY